MRSTHHSAMRHRHGSRRAQRTLQLVVGLRRARQFDKNHRLSPAMVISATEQNLPVQNDGLSSVLPWRHVAA